MSIKLLNIGFGNSVVLSKIVAVLTTGSAPIKRLKDDAKTTGRLLDATQGRKTRSVIITDSNHIILSGIQAETLAMRINNEDISK